MGPGFVHPGNMGALALKTGLELLQWGPGLYTREIHPSPHPTSSTRSFNGARVCTPGKCGALSFSVSRATCRASMGPGFVHPGNRRVGCAGDRGLVASMGPGFVHPGNKATSVGVAIVLRFNGARVCTPGKSAEARPDLPSRGASMGPGFVHPGNPSRATPPPRPAALQWGPGLYTREMCRGCSSASTASGFNGARVCTPGKCPLWTAAPAAQRASMGPGFVHPGNPSCQPRSHRPRLGLQWGPGLYTREMAAGCRSPPPLRRFNGARVCTPGKSAAAFGRVWLAALQWGPGLYTREIRTPARGCVKRNASMGPGFVHPGNEPDASRFYRSRGFNGARVCTPGKCVLQARVDLGLRASMGPGFVHPGNGPVLAPDRSPPPASMGPGFVHPGNAGQSRQA